MKKLSKSKLDRVIALSRDIWETGEIATIYARIEAAKEITEVDWMRVLDLVDFILGPEGFKPDAENYEIYLVLGVLGWEVTDEEHTSD